MPHDSIIFGSLFSASDVEYLCVYLDLWTVLSLLPLGIPSSTAQMAVKALTSRLCLLLPPPPLLPYHAASTTMVPICTLQWSEQGQRAQLTSVSS